jgi:hypothetical protein
VKVGDLIVNALQEEPYMIYQVVRAPYTARFMDSQDWEMVDNGMGEYAGSYTSAIDIAPMSGKDVGAIYKKKRACNFRIISNSP